MSEVLVYIGKVFVIQALFYALYKLVLKQSLRHSWNRFYLLSVLILSFGIPLIKSPYQQRLEPLNTDYVITWVQESAMAYELIPIISASESAFNYWSVLPWLYGAIVCYLISRSVAYLFILQKLKKHSEYVKKRWFKLFKISQPRPFSFFSNVFIPEQIFGTSSFDQILAHECVHVKQRHSYDRLLMDFLVSLFWFNPFIYWYRNALIEIHEFQADEAVIRRFKDPVGYQEILFSQLQVASYSGLVSHFNFSMIKKRIVMMNKQKNKYAGWVYVLALPVVLSVIFAFSNREAIEPIEKVGTELAEILSPKPGFVLSGFNLPEPKATTQENRTPSILPLKDTENVRMTSGFGSRYDPIEKEEKLHRGMDLATPIGNPVLATGDGKIELAKEDGKHGLRVIIKHDDAFTSAYSHLSSIDVKAGESVKKGDQIGLSGNSGASTAPHLHYEIQKDDEYVNPVYYIGDYNFKVKTKQGELMEAERQKAVRHAERQQAEKEMLLAKEEAERAIHMQREADEMRKVEEKQKEKEKNKDKEKSKQKDKSKQKAFRVIIDPGHGGGDLGATSPSGTLEKEVALSIAGMVKENFIDDQSVEVILTRSTDIAISLRSRIETAQDADLLISLHTDNYAGEDSFIFPVFYDKNEFTERSNELANFLASQLESIGKEAKVGYSEDPFLLKEAPCPAVLLNVGFFSDPDEDKFLSSARGQRQVADKVTDAIKLALL